MLLNIKAELWFLQELYKTTEELEEKKADKQMVESEIVSGFILTYERENTVRVFTLYT